MIDWVPKIVYIHDKVNYIDRIKHKPHDPKLTIKMV